MSLTVGVSRVLQHVVQRLLGQGLVKFIRVPRITATDTEPELQHVRATIWGDARCGVDIGKLDFVGRASLWVTLHTAFESGLSQ